MKQWFGEDAFTNEATRAEIQRILNSAARVLSSVDYVFPGADCGASVLGYVNPTGDGARNEHGQLIMNICPMFFNEYFSNEDLQVETITHEASHHAVAFTDDVCMEDGKMLNL